MGKREGLDERSTHLYEQRRAVGAAEAAQCAPCPQVGKHGDLLRVRVLLGTAVIVAFAFAVCIGLCLRGAQMGGWLACLDGERRCVKRCTCAGGDGVSN